ncbi:MAG: alpha/beta hydrolase-fold protein [Bacteroidota bacterium]
MHRFIFFILISLSFLAKAQENNFSKRTTTLSIGYPQLKTTKKVWVYLPKNYTLKNKKFPVIYILEGQNIFDINKTTNWNIDEMLTELHDNVILVGIENTVNDNLLDFITTVLKPKIDKQFKTKSDAYNTGIIGSSQNGLIAFKAVLNDQKTFGKAGVLSPTVAENDSIYDKILKEKKLKSKIFIFSSETENAKIAKDIYKMEYALNTNRCYCLNLTKVFLSEELDSEKLWRQGFEKAYLWLM